MEQRTIQILFALLRSALYGTKLTETGAEQISQEQINELLSISKKHDIEHLLAFGLKQNNLIPKDDKETEKRIFKAVYRYERLNFDYLRLCSALEEAQIPFIPLKGAVLRNFYPEAWMRTSCDLDVLVHREDLEKAVFYLVQNLKYIEKERTIHDVSLFSPNGNHIELHFDLLEEGRMNNANSVLAAVWKNVSLHKNCKYQYEMTDAFFYFYHIAHMAKHFENGGCGIRPFIDLQILDNIDGADQIKRDDLLSEGGLIKFANAARKLSNIWFGDGPYDELSLKMQGFILHGGVYGTTDNRVALRQQKKGSRFAYLLSRIFIPYSMLKSYYPILEKHRWLTPFMQIIRWFRILKPNVAKTAKQEIKISHGIEKSEADEMNIFLDKIGLI